MNQFVYTDTNKIKGIFPRYGLFTMRLPIIEEEYVDYLRLAYPIASSALGIYAEKFWHFRNEGECSSDCFILFHGDYKNKQELDVKLIIPIIDKEYIAANSYGIPYEILFYNTDDKCFQYYAHLCDYNERRDVIYKPGFDYKIRCLGEYEYECKINWKR